MDEAKVENWPELEGNTGMVQFVNTKPAVEDNPETTDIDESAEASTTYKVGNIPGTQLPMTGGIGTTLFTALGGLMTATAGAILTLTAHRRRKQHA